MVTMLKYAALPARYCAYTGAMTHTPGMDLEPRERRRGPKQATIPPVVSDGVLPFRIGLGLCCLVLLISLIFGAPEWLRLVALVGSVIGSLGLIYCTQRRD